MSNYVDWARKMRCALKLYKIWVEPTQTPAELQGEDVAKNEKAFSFMASYLDAQNSAFFNTTDEKCFITAWNNIKNFHQPRSSTELVDIHRKIRALKHKTGEPIKLHLLNLDILFSRLHEVGEPLSGRHQVAIILLSVSDSPEFVNFYCSAMFKGENSFTTDTLKSILIETQRCQRSFSNPLAQPPFLKKHNRRPRDPVKGWDCKICEMDNHFQKFCRKKSKFIHKLQLRNDDLDDTTEKVATGPIRRPDSEMDNHSRRDCETSSAQPQFLKKHNRRPEKGATGPIFVLWAPVAEDDFDTAKKTIYQSSGGALFTEDWRFIREMINRKAKGRLWVFSAGEKLLNFMSNKPIIFAMYGSSYFRANIRILVWKNGKYHKTCIEINKLSCNKKSFKFKDFPASSELKTKKTPRRWKYRRTFNDRNALIGLSLNPNNTGNEVDRTKWIKIRKKKTHAGSTQKMIRKQMHRIRKKIIKICNSKRKD